MAIMFLDFTGDDTYYTYTFNDNYWNYATSCLPEYPKHKNKKANIFIRIKWLMLILIWKFNNRQWKKCRQKIKALGKYKKNIDKRL